VFILIYIGGAWRPRGVLMSTLADHKRPITTLCVADDHSFFVSGADDGAVKVWDAAGIYGRESNHSIATTLTPRLTYTGLTGQIRALVPVEDSCSVAVAGGGKRGQVHVLRLDAARLGADAHGNGNGVAGSTTNGCNYYWQCSATNGFHY
jgi:phosphoinositide-3-kinase, regulatory subunit 4